MWTNEPVEFELRTMGAAANYYDCVTAKIGRERRWIKRATDWLSEAEKCPASGGRKIVMERLCVTL